MAIQALRSMRYALPAVVVAGLAGAAPAAHADLILYTETFPWTGNSTSQDQALRDEGWCGGNAGDDFGFTNGNCNPVVAGPDSANQGGEGAISSSLNGPDGVLGFAFWSQTAIGADSFLYTQEYPVHTSQLKTIRWYQRNTNASSGPAHLAFRIGTDWYISDQTFLDSSNTWVPTTVGVSTLTFFKRESSDPAKLPDGGVVAGGLTLPEGEVNAFGFWWDGPKGATSRVDDFTLEGEVRVDLLARKKDKTIDLGDVHVATVNDRLTVTIAADGPWCINKAYLAVGETLDDIPQRSDGCPLLPDFPYSYYGKIVKTPYPAPYTATIPSHKGYGVCASTVVFEGVAFSGEEPVIAVNAYLFNKKTQKFASAWAAGETFPDCDGAATYFTVTPVPPVTCAVDNGTQCAIVTPDLID